MQNSPHFFVEILYIKILSLSIPLFDFLIVLKFIDISMDFIYIVNREGDRMSININLGNNIRARRETLGLSIENLAHMSDLSPNHLGKIERGLKVPRIDTLQRISFNLNISLSELLASCESGSLIIPAKRLNKVEALLIKLDDDEFGLIYNFIKDFVLWKAKKH